MEVLESIYKYIGLIIIYVAAETMAINNTIQEQKILVGNRIINYATAGHGPHKVLCLTGALGTWDEFHPQLERFDPDKFTLIAWDPPGYGKSRPPNKQFPLDFFDRDADAAALFMKTLNINSYFVLGWSDGGITGMILAAKYPNNIKKMAIWGAQASILKSEAEAYEESKDFDTWPEEVKQYLIAVYGEQDFFDLWTRWVDGMLNIYHQRNGDICIELLPKIRCPVFILHGDKDTEVDASHVPFLLAHIHNSRAFHYPDGDHIIHLVYVDDFNNRVQNFLLGKPNPCKT